MTNRLKEKTELLKEIEAERKDLWADYHKKNKKEVKVDPSKEEKV